MNLTVFRLATCCGLRASEIVGLKLSDVRVGIARPYILIRAAIAKRKIGRRVPLWWDQGTLDDLTAWKDERTRQGAGQGDSFICSQARPSFGKQIDRRNVRLRFISACLALGTDRQREITIHQGRHSFVSHSLAGGRTLAEVRDAAGHANIATTSIYTHITADDDGMVGNLFVFPMEV